MFFTPFSTLFHFHRSGQFTYPCFSGVLSTGAQHNILSKPLLFHITIVESMESGEGGMNSVTITIFNHKKEYLQSRGSNQRPPVSSLVRYRLRCGVRLSDKEYILQNIHVSLIWQTLGFYSGI